MTKKNKIIIAVGLAFLIFFGIAAYFIFRITVEDEMRGLAPVYFFNASEGRLEAEYQNVFPNDINIQVSNAALEMALEPKGVNLLSVFPNSDDFLQGMTIDENIVIANFSAELYEQMSPRDEVIFRSAFTLTMTGLPDIEGVLFRLNGEESTKEFFESGESISNNPFISPTRRSSENFTLFFADESGEGLISVVYNADYVNIHTRTQHILSLLIEEQTAPGVMQLIPPETRVRDILVDLDSGIYVDLSSEFHSRFTGTSAQARLMIQSITHTILESDKSNSPRRVFFLIDSERLDEFHGISDFNLGFTVDNTMMMGYEPEPELEDKE